MSIALHESFSVLDATFRYLAISVLGLLLVKLLFHPAILAPVNLSILIVGIVVVGAARLVLS